MTMTINGLTSLLDRVAEGARAAGVFGQVEVKGSRLNCTAPASAAPAAYRVEPDGGRLWVSFVTPDRWLSGSIELDLIHTGDKLDELLEEELVDQEYPGEPFPFEHFRSEDKLFTFRSPLPVDAGQADPARHGTLVLKALLAYEACFRNLGDVNAGAEEED